MPTNGIERISLDQWTREHDVLDREIGEWRVWWNELAQLGQPRLGEMRDRLAHFRDHLAAHFRTEEVGILPTLTGLDSAVREHLELLFDEHEQMLQATDALIEKLSGDNPEIDCWGKARDEFEEILNGVLCHEILEAEFIEEHLA